MDENAQKTPLFIKIGELVFFLLSLVFKLALIIFALVAAFLVCFFMWADYVDTYGNPSVIKLINESARVVVKDHVGIENFQIEQVSVHTAVFDGAGGNWKVTLDEPFHLDATRLLQKGDMNDLVRNPEPLKEIALEGFEKLYGVRPTGYECFEGEDIVTGPETLCEGKSLRKCNVSVCVKEGERLTFLYIAEF